MGRIMQEILKSFQLRIVTLLYQHKLLAEGEIASWQIRLSIWIFSVGISFPKEQRPALSYTHKYIALKYTVLKQRCTSMNLFIFG